MKTIQYYLSSLILVLLLMGNIPGHAQLNTLYHMQQIPGATEQNPALPPSCNGYFLFPGIATIDLQFHTNAFSYWDVMQRDQDTLVLDINQLADHLGDNKNNSVRFNTNLNLLGFGFRTNKMYWTFGITNKSEVRLGLPGGLANIRTLNYDVNKGTTQDIDFSGLGLDVINYTEIAIGASREIIPGLVAGLKFKRLWGASNIHTQKSDLLLSTDPDSYSLTAQTDFVLNATYALDIEYDENGEVKNVKPQSPNIAKDLVFNKNRGVAFDLGVMYELDDRFSFSAAVIDLGGIKWDNNANKLLINNRYDFDGLDIGPDEDGNIDFDAALDEVGDTLSSFTDMDVEEDISYYSPLTTKIMLNANYHLGEKVMVSALNRYQLYDGRMHPSLTLGLQADATQWLTAKLSYSMMHRTYSNFGFGLGIRAGFFQFYMVNDNIRGLLNPHDSQSMLTRFGINFVFGCKKKIDQSLIE